MYVDNRECGSKITVHFTSGAAIQMTLVIGMLKSSGLLFVAFQERFHSNSSTTSLISTVLLIFYSLTCKPLMNRVLLVVDFARPLKPQ